MDRPDQQRGRANLLSRERGRVAMKVQLQMVDLGDVLEETRDYAPVGFRWDSYFVWSYM